MNLLQKLIFVENCIIGNFKNYVLLNTSQRCLVILRTIAQSSFFGYIAYTNILTTNDLSIELSAKCVTDTNQILIWLEYFLITVGSIRHSRSYQLLYEKVTIIHNRSLCNPHYVKNLRNLKLQCFVSAVIFIFSLFIAISFEIYRYWNIFPGYIRISVLPLIHFGFVDSWYIFEHLVTYWAVTGINNFLKNLNDSVQIVLERYIKEKPSSKSTTTCVEVEEESSDIPDAVSSWRESYQLILTCTEHMSHFVNELTMFSSFAVTHLSVSTTYTVVVSLSKDIGYFDDNSFTIFVMMYHLMATTVLYVAGQKIKNECELFSKVLARLCCEVVPDRPKSETRQLKDLYRLVVTRPVVIQFKKLTLNMSLLPAMLSFIATSIVVLLQFNHVV